MNSESMIVTGASGFIGRQLVPLLKERGFTLLLVGRKPDLLEQLFPGTPNCSYSEIISKGANFECLLHLAVLNNSAVASEEEFESVNVKLFAEVIKAGKKAGVRQFFNITTFHALGEHDSLYARSKAKALEMARNETGLTVTNILLPAVYGNDFAGRLSFLNKVPNILRNALLMCVSALFPTMHVDRLVTYLIGGALKNQVSSDVFLADPKTENLIFSFAKRLIDLSFAVMVIVFFWWLLVAVWVAIRLDSKGPGIFSQKRVGLAGSVFTCYKFRTMRVGTKQVGTHELTQDSVTRLGSFLRRTKLDELPQIWNILRGELSLVGPRPCLPTQLALVQERQKRGVFAIRLGITGLSQINGIDMSNPILLARWDAQYIALQSLLLDIKIIVGTFVGRGQGDKVRV